MTEAFIGLIGAAFGACTALVGSFLSDRRQARQEEVRWRRDRMGAAYEAAMRHLLRALNRRAVVSGDDPRVWFDDLVEAQVWLRTLSSHCGRSQRSRVLAAAGQLDSAVRSARAGEDERIMAVLDEAVRTVADCARVDLDG